MKKILIGFLALLYVPSIVLAARIPIAQLTGSTTNKYAERAGVNTVFGNLETMMVELYGSSGGTVTATGFDGNLSTTDDTLQEIAQKLDDLVLGGAASVSDVAYNESTWNGVVDVAPSKNAVRDAFEALPTLTFSTGLTNTDGTITVTANTYQAYDADLTSWGGITPGTGVGPMLAISPGSAGGPTTTIASGTIALGTTTVNTGACTTISPVTATGVATTDVINWGFNGDPTGATGYAASANGMLTIIVWPTAGNVAAKVCNNTAANITPGAVTLNWRVQR